MLHIQSKKLGAKERLILGSNRSYDNGNISGYIKDTNNNPLSGIIVKINKRITM